MAKTKQIKVTVAPTPAPRTRVRRRINAGDALSSVTTFFGRLGNDPIVTALVLVASLLLFRHFSTTVESDIDWVGDKVDELLKPETGHASLACKIWSQPKKTFGILSSALPLAPFYRRADFIWYVGVTLAAVILLPPLSYTVYALLAVGVFFFGVQSTPRNRKIALVVLCVCLYIAYSGHKTQSARDTGVTVERKC